MIKTDVLFNGYYGYSNTGDDAFVDVASWGSKNIWKKNNVRFLIKENNIPQTITDVSGYPLSLPKTYSLQQKLLIKNTKAFVLAGGSTLCCDISSQVAKSLSLKTKLEKGDDYKLGAIGVSIGPFESVQDEKSVQNYLRNMDFLVLRDKRSFDYANSLSLPVKSVEGFDLAALLPQMYTDIKKILKEDKKVVSISICNYESYKKNGNVEKEKRRLQAMRELITALDLSRDDLSFKFILINGNSVNGDSQCTSEVLQDISFNNEFEIVPYNSSPKQVYELIAKSHFVLSVRLHAAIFACFANTPFMLVEYHKKCSDFLEDVGVSDEQRIFDIDVPIATILDKINDVLNDENVYQFPRNTQKMIEKSSLNFTTINL